MARLCARAPVESSTVIIVPGRPMRSIFPRERRFSGSVASYSANLMLDEPALTASTHAALPGEPRSLMAGLHRTIGSMQTKEYRESVLPPAVRARVAVEQASTLGWERYVGSAGTVIGMKTFGASAPLKELQRKFGFEPGRVTAAAKAVIGRK